MEDFLPIIGGVSVIIGIAVVIGFVSWIVSLYSKARSYRTLKPKLDDLEAYEDQLDERAVQLDDRKKNILALAEEKEQAVQVLARQKAVGFPWLAGAYAELNFLFGLKEAETLENKKHPAPVAADKLREYSKKRREAEKEARILRYQIQYYETLFPWLVELKSEEVEDELIRIRQETAPHDDVDDPARRWLTPEEYERLSITEKYQLALDRYWTKKKTKWEIGRDYERYIGYKYERQGSEVYYQGIVEGFADLGRDLIVTKGSKVRVAQCKCWSSHKTIHEKHIFQLYGTCVAYQLDNPDKEVTGHFVTSTRLSEMAREFAGFLKIKVTENLPFQRYPCIKCNVSRRTGEKIYHLPFDQQYDRTSIEIERGECYVSTIAEAEERGFRRAFRYRGAEASV